MEDKEKLQEELQEEKETIAGEETEPEEVATESDDAAEETDESGDNREETPEDDNNEESQSDSEDNDGKKFFKKKDKKQDAMKERVDELEDKVKRQLAEFENFRNRTEKEKTQMFETGAKSVIEKILPVVDNFERGLNAVPEEEKGSSFAQGMELIYKQLMTELEKLEVKPIEAVGAEFDPNFHNAVMQVESEEYDTGVIAQELLKGYTYRGQVVRHSMVAVVQ